MPTDLNTLKTRIKTALMDTGSAVWDDATITEGLRLALGEYGLAGKAAVTLSGLDSATETTLPALHEQAIIWGAGAYCALSRAVDRAESSQLGSTASDLKTWGDQRLREFKALLGSIFPGYLVVLSGSAGGGSTGGEDPAKTAAEIALMGAQADLAQAQAAASTGQETRAQAASDQAAADRAAEAARLAELRGSADSPWENWPDRREPHYPSDYERS